MKHTIPFTKRILALALTLVLVFSLTGCCGYKITTELKSDGTSTMTFKYLYEKSFYDEMATSDTSTSPSPLTSGDFTQSTETIGKYTYYAFSRDFSFSSYDELKNFLCDLDSYKNAMKKNSKNPSSYDDALSTAIFSDVTVNESLFKATLSTTTKEAGMELAFGADEDDLSDISNYNEYYQNEMGVRMDFSLTFPSAPTASNGTISGNTVTWDLAGLSSSNMLIAEVGGSLISSDTTAPVIKGVKNGAVYKKVKIASASDNVCVQSFTVNGQNQGNSDIMLGLKGDGKYKLVATDIAGNVTTCTVTIDMKKPSIKGAKSGKTYKKNVTLKFKDKSGIQKITVNGKKIKKCSSKKFTKSGKYKVKVTDKAGNTSTMIFSIKKK